MKFLLSLTLSFLIIYGCGAESLEFLSSKAYQFGEDATMSCIGDFSGVPDKENVSYTAKWKVTIGVDTYALVVQKKGSSPGVYDNAPEQFKGRFEIDASQVLEEGKMIGTLRNVTAADQATYRCELEFDGGDGSLFSFTGQGGFEVYKQPQLQIHNVNNPLNLETSVELDNGTMITEAVGEMVVASCLITNAYPKPVAIKWTSTNADGDVQVMEGDFMNHAEFVENPDNSWNVSSDLLITPDLSYHLEQFQCGVDLGIQVMNEYESQMSNRLLINHPITEVKFSVSPKKKVKEGEQFTMTCETDGYPLADQMKLYRITTQEVLLQATETEFEQVLIFRHHTAYRNQAGRYICRVGSVDKVIDLNVLYYDEAVEMKRSSTKPLFVGDSLTISCSHSANPKQTISMMRPNGQWEKTEQIVIDNALVSDSGEYKCKTNSKQVTQKKINVQFQDKCRPVMTQQLTQASEGHLLVTVRCSTPGANPTCKIDIVSDDTSLESKVTDSTPNFLAKQFIVDALGLSKIPTFTCTARSSLGDESSTIEADKGVLVKPPREGGMSPGIVVVIILAVTFVLVGLPYAYYKFCKKPANDRHIKGSQLDSVEVEKLEAGEHDENMDI